MRTGPNMPDSPTLSQGLLSPRISSASLRPSSIITHDPPTPHRLHLHDITTRQPASLRRKPNIHHLRAHRIPLRPIPQRNTRLPKRHLGEIRQRNRRVRPPSKREVLHHPRRLGPAQPPSSPVFLKHLPHPLQRRPPLGRRTIPPEILHHHHHHPPIFPLRSDRDPQQIPRGSGEVCKPSRRRRRRSPLLLSLSLSFLRLRRELVPRGGRLRPAEGAVVEHVDAGAEGAAAEGRGGWSISSSGWGGGAGAAVDAHPEGGCVHPRGVVRRRAGRGHFRAGHADGGLDGGDAAVVVVGREEGEDRAAFGGFSFPFRGVGERGGGEGVDIRPGDGGWGVEEGKVVRLAGTGRWESDGDGCC
ncbi:hypothetical protein VTK56DRAFT_9444 [Thermocarpiscus australiensis]